MSTLTEDAPVPAGCARGVAAVRRVMERAARARARARKESGAMSARLRGCAHLPQAHGDEADGAWAGPWRRRLRAQPDAQAHGRGGEDREEDARRDRDAPAPPTRRAVHRGVAARDALPARVAGIGWRRHLPQEEKLPRARGV